MDDAEILQFRKLCEKDNCNPSDKLRSLILPELERIAELDRQKQAELEKIKLAEAEEIMQKQKADIERELKSLKPLAYNFSPIQKQRPKTDADVLRELINLIFKK